MNYNEKDDPTLEKFDKWINRLGYILGSSIMILIGIIYGSAL